MKKTLLSIAAILASLNAAVAQNGITELPDADHVPKRQVCGRV